MQEVKERLGDAESAESWAAKGLVMGGHHRTYHEAMMAIIGASQYDHDLLLSLRVQAKSMIFLLDYDFEMLFRIWEELRVSEVSWRAANERRVKLVMTRKDMEGARFAQTVHPGDRGHAGADVGRNDRFVASSRSGPSRTDTVTFLSPPAGPSRTDTVTCLSPPAA